MLYQITVRVSTLCSFMREREREEEGERDRDRESERERARESDRKRARER